MTKIQFVKDTGIYKSGEVVTANEGDAREVVDNGFAKYIEQKDVRKWMADNMFKDAIYNEKKNIIELKNFNPRENQNGQDKKFQLINSFVDKIDMAKQFISRVPMFYDKNKMFWVWNDAEYVYEMCDETDIMVMIKKNILINTVESKEKNEILEALKQVGRMNHPKPFSKKWIQFKSKIIDLENNLIMDSSSEYFAVNPIPWDIGESDETPTMDRIFAEWVGKDNVKLLYQIIAYSIIPDYPIHRVFCVIGRGRNGKSKFLRLSHNFIGSRNVCSSSLDKLLASRFESFKLYKKLVCLMGETNFTELNDSDTFKRVTGEDVIGFEMKGKNPFDDFNYAKVLIATNSLPETKDKTEGFYSRWIIIDFPNQFNEEKDILAEIPQVEYNNLAKKCVNLLQELLKTRKFHKEGQISDRAKRYEEKSNPLNKFIEETMVRDLNGYVFQWQFKEKFKTWLADKGMRVWMDKDIANKMNEKYETSQRGDNLYRVWLHIRFKQDFMDWEVKN